MVEADILLHVIDFSDDNHYDYIDQVNKVLSEIGVSDKPQIAVYNKIDKLDYTLTPNLTVHCKQNPLMSVYISAENQLGIDVLLSSLQQYYNKSWIYGILTLLPTEAKIRAHLYELNLVESEDINNDGQYKLTVLMAKKDFTYITSLYNININLNFKPLNQHT